MNYINYSFRRKLQEQYFNIFLNKSFRLNHKPLLSYDLIEFFSYKSGFVKPLNNDKHEKSQTQCP